MKKEHVVRTLIIAALIISSLNVFPQGRNIPVSPSKDTNIEQKINALLAKMTLAEKLGQLQQLDGEGNGNFRPEHLELLRKGLLGSTLNVRGAQRTNQIQHVAMDESRLKIPLLLGFDV